MRKNLTFLSLLLLTAISATAQTIGVNTIDKAAGTRLIMTSNHDGGTIDLSDSVAKDGTIFFSAGYQEAVVHGKEVGSYFIDLNILHNDNKLGCLREATSKIVLSLSDGSEMECFQVSESDCGAEAFRGTFALIPKGGSTADMDKNFQKLITTEIEDIKVIATEGTLHYNIRSKQRKYLKNHFALVDKTIKEAVK